MVTPDGQRLVGGAVLERVEAEKTTVVVSDGSQTVSAPLDQGFPHLNEGATALIFQATFGPEEANFEWKAEGIEVGGKRIEWEEKDSGRKALGATWTVQITIDIKP